MESSPLNQLEGFFKNKRVLLTGHTGFKGSWMALILHYMGAKVHGLSLAPESSPNHYEEAKIRDLLASEHIGDISDFDFFKGVIEKTRPQIIIHMAAQAIVLDSYEVPRETFMTNTIGVVNLLEAIRVLKNPCHCLVVTTDKCYENKEWVYPYRENDPLGGRDPYSASKATAEIVTHSYKESFFPMDRIDDHGVFIQSARGGNVIGGGDWSSYRILPDCIKALEKGKKILIRNPFSIRPWQHVLDVCYGYLLLMAKESQRPTTNHQAWNFGPLNDVVVPVEELVKIVLQEWGQGDYEIEYKNTKKSPHEAKYLKLDTSKARELLGWNNSFNGVEAIKQAVQWYRTQFDKKDALSTRERSLREIKEYFTGESSRGRFKTRNLTTHSSIL